MPTFGVGFRIDRNAKNNRVLLGSLCRKNPGTGRKVFLRANAQAKLWSHRIIGRAAVSFSLLLADSRFNSMSVFRVILDHFPNKFEVVIFAINKSRRIHYL